MCAVCATKESGNDAAFRAEIGAIFAGKGAEFRDAIGAGIGAALSKAARSALGRALSAPKVDALALRSAPLSAPSAPVEDAPSARLLAPRSMPSAASGSAPSAPRSPSVRSRAAPCALVEGAVGAETGAVCPVWALTLN